MKAFTTLEEMYKSEEYESFICDKLGNDLFINDPERAERIQEYAEEGCNGSTHREMVEDWRYFIDSTLKAFDPEYDDIEDIEKYDITLVTHNNIYAEIATTEEWHTKNGSIDSIIN